MKAGLAEGMDGSFIEGMLLERQFSQLFRNEIHGTYTNLKLEELACRKGGILFLITVYNEPGDALKVSLAALENGIRYLYSAVGERHSVNITVCIILDGYEDSCPSTMGVLYDLGLNTSVFNFKGNDMFFYMAKERLSSLNLLKSSDSESQWDEIYKHSLKCKIADFSLNDTASYSDRPIQLLIGVKQRNAGKLDSHWWYYEKVCGHINPDYCFQMDAGTCPATESVFKVWEAFELDPNMGAAATSLYTKPPKNPLDILAVWQYGDFARNSLIGIWSESASGYIGVIPGQFSAIRWEALKNGRQHPDDVRPQPLEVYFKGLGALNPRESAMYLTEDRILCNEIVTRSESNWKIEYIDSAIAITDGCESWDELLRQRKRWNTGALFSKISFAKNLKHYLSDDHAVSRKVDRIKSVLYHSLRGAADWFLLGVFIYTFTALSSLAFPGNSGITTGYSAISLFGGIIFASVLTQIYIFLKNKKDRWGRRILASTVVVQVICCVVVGVLAMGNSPMLVGFTCIMFLTFLLSVLIEYLLNKRLKGVIPALIKSSVQYSLVNPSISLMLCIYSVCNVHDNSWGTKGLNIPEYDKVKRAEYLNFRKRYVALWFASNVALVLGLYLAFSGHQIIGVICIMMISVIEGLVSLVTIVVKRCRLLMLDESKNIQESGAIISWEVDR